MAQRRLVDTDGVALYLTTTKTHVRKLVASRKIPHLKIGKFLRFDLDDIDAWLEGNVVPTRADLIRR
jgi:excisionase family DNA binding protein